MADTDLGEILRGAMEAERDGFAFYTQAAERSEDPGARKTFARLLLRQDEAIKEEYWNENRLAPLLQCSERASGRTVRPLVIRNLRWIHPQLTGGEEGEDSPQANRRIGLTCSVAACVQRSWFSQRRRQTPTLRR